MKKRLMALQSAIVLMGSVSLAENTEASAETPATAEPMVSLPIDFSPGMPADPDGFMQLVMCLFTNQVHELINELQKNPDDIEAKGPQALDALLESWVKKLTKEKCDA